MIDQLPLNIQLRDEATFSNYCPVANPEAMSAIQDFSRGTGESFLYIWGQEGVGRTHLLQAACQAAGEKGLAAVYIPLQDRNRLSLNLLLGIEDIPLVCIDDIDEIAGRPEWEEALFHLFNRIRAANGRLLISSLVAPKDLSIALPDLKSRLAWGVVYQIHRLEDEQKIQALQLRAKQRGLLLNKSVGQFLISRCSRDMTELFNTLTILDRASLAEQRRLTIPFVKQILEL